MHLSTHARTHTHVRTPQRYLPPFICTNLKDVSYNYSLLVGTTQRLNLARGLNYSFTVNFEPHNISAVVFQLHTQKDNITLKYSSLDCTGAYGCGTIGTDVGLVSSVRLGVTYFQYMAFIACHGNQCDPVPVLAAAVSLSERGEKCCVGTKAPASVASMFLVVS